MAIATDSEERVDHFTASATCQVTLPLNGGDLDGLDIAGAEDDPRLATFEVSFDTAARGCATTAAFDPDRDRNVYRLTSLLTVFHSDDTRPSWLQAVESLTGGISPEQLPRPVSDLAARLVQHYGPGSITVIQDPERPVIGEVVATERGPDGEMFPARSYFDQYLVVKVGGRTFTNEEPLRVSGTVNRWPPGGEVYRSERITNFYDSEDLDGAPAFAFGKCTIEIGEPLSDDEIAGMNAVIETLRQ